MLRQSRDFGFRHARRRFPNARKRAGRRARKIYTRAAALRGSFFPRRLYFLPTTTCCCCSSRTGTAVVVPPGVRTPERNADDRGRAIMIFLTFIIVVFEKKTSEEKNASCEKEPPLTRLKRRMKNTEQVGRVCFAPYVRASLASKYCVAL